MRLAPPFWSMFFGFGEPTWFQNGGKLGPQNASMSETLKIKKSPLAAARASFFYDFCDASCSPKRAKIAKKNEWSMGRHLGIDFDRLWWISRAKLGAKMEQTIIQEGI